MLCKKTMGNPSHSGIRENLVERRISTSASSMKHSHKIHAENSLKLHTREEATEALAAKDYQQFQKRVDF